MNKITRKPRGIQVRWIEYPKYHDIYCEPIKMRKYSKKVKIQNKKFIAHCYKWFDEFENEFTYALWVFELINGEYKEALHSGHCHRLTKSRLKKVPRLLKLLEMRNERKINTN